MTVQRHLLGGDAGGRFGQQACQSERGGTFATTALSDERNGFTLLECEADTFDGFHRFPVMTAEFDLKIADTQQWGVFFNGGVGHETSGGSRLYDAADLDQTQGNKRDAATGVQ